MGKVNLSDIVNLPAFEDAGSLFHQATGMTISFYDDSGQVVFYPAEKRCAFCHLIQSTPEGRSRCQSSDANAAEEALCTGKPKAYTCHAGLVDVVVPVVVAGKRVGCFFSGQSLLQPQTAMGYQEIRTKINDLDIDPDRLWDAYQMVPTVDESRLEIAMGLLSVICNHLVEQEIALRNERALALEQRKLRKAAEERTCLERDLREMELRLIQAQVNPHFLFNALNLIVGKAMAEYAPQTTGLIEDLSLLLRNSLRKVGSMVSLADEVASASAYVEIFSARFGRQIEMSIDLSSELRDFQVPALILQPLVENALVHALPRCDVRFILSITAFGDEITVADNGPGSSPSDLEAIRQATNSREPETKLTGLAGVNRRLKYYYEDIDNLRLEVSDGFRVTIKIPGFG
ncbi:MAG: sensor histidine kinase [Armatimonadota bacterium]